MHGTNGSFSLCTDDFGRGGLTQPRNDVILLEEFTLDVVRILLALVHLIPNPGLSGVPHPECNQLRFNKLIETGIGKLHLASKNTGGPQEILQNGRLASRRKDFGIHHD
ncbi:MAG: hypothetical protein ACRD4C_07230 [Candidatus Acidiferrales bacterium]